MHAQHTVGRRVGEHLHLADGVVDRAGPPVGPEREHPLLERHPRGSELFLSLADGGDLGMREYDGRHEIVVDVGPPALHRLDAGHAVLLGLVGEHRPRNTVANRIHACRGGAELAVHGDAAPSVERDPDGVEPQIVGRRPSARGRQHPITLDRLLALAFDDTRRADSPRTLHLHPQADVEPLLAKQRQGLRRDIAIEPCQDAIGVLEHRHLRPQPPPHAAEFQADIAAADHDEMPRHRVEGERLSARADEPAIDLDAGQHDALAADREDDAGRVERRARAVARGHLDPPRAGETARATHPGHLILGEQGLDALGERRDDVVFPLHHGGKIE